MYRSINSTASQRSAFVFLFYPPLLQLRRGDEARRAVLCVLQLALPPVVVVLGDDLDDVTHPEAYARLLTRDEVVFRRVVLELSAYVNLRGRDSGGAETCVGCGSRGCG